MPITSEAERRAWAEQAGLLREKLDQEYVEIYSSLPHEIEHYLVDEDIRAKEPGYAKYQEGILAELLFSNNDKLGA